jgi:chitinase
MTQQLTSRCPENHWRFINLGAAFASLALLGGCIDGGSSPPKTNVVNSVPVANPGADQTVLNGTLVSLNAGGSTDADTDILRYSWVFVSRPVGSAAELKGPLDVEKVNLPFDPRQTFTPDVPGSYIVQLTVTDGYPNSTVTDTVTISSVPAPDANAGPDQDVSFVVAGTTVTLDGTGSSDPSGLPLTYDWQILSFSGAPPAVSAALVGANTATPTFDITALDQLGAYTIQLTVSNGTQVVSDQVVVTVAKSLPTALGLLGGGIFAAAGAALRRRWKSRISKSKATNAGTGR